MKNLITSYIDENYYIINRKEPELMYLAVILLERDYNHYANLLLDYWHEIRVLENQTKPKEPNKMIFVNKTSSFGIVLTKLITDKKIIDESLMIRKEYLVNALINLTKTNDTTEIYHVIKELIKNDTIGPSIELSKNYSIDALKTITKTGTKNIYLSTLNTDLTGFEERGYLHTDEGICYLFNITTKEKQPLTPEYKVKKKVLS